MTRLLSPETARRLLDDLKGPAFVSFLDLARWLAAAIVFVSHLRAPLFVGYADIAAEDRSIAVTLWYFVTGWHVEAVVVFFVLSGYLVGAASAAKLALGRFDPADYAAARIARLYVAFVPALVLTLVLDLAGSHALSGSGLWDHSHPQLAAKIAGPAFGSLLDPATFAGNLAMLQTFAVPPLGSNGPLWTIAYEFWFYAVFGLCALGARSRTAWPAAVAAVALALALGPVFLAYLGLWLIGAGLSAVPVAWRSPVLPALALFLAVLCTARVFDAATDASDLLRMAKNYAVAVSFALLVHSMRGRTSAWLVRGAGLNRGFADFSFSLYLIHYPVMIFLLAALWGTGLVPQVALGYAPNSAEGLSLYAGIILAVYLSAFLFSRATERWTPDLRRRLACLFQPRQA